MKKTHRFHVDIQIGYRTISSDKGPHCSGGSFRVVFEGHPKENGVLTASPNWTAIRYKMLQWLGAKVNHRLLIWNKDPIYPAFRGYDPTIVELPVEPTPDNIGEYLESVCVDQLQGYGCTITSVKLYSFPLSSSCPV